ncbi:MAG: hypothetical protein IJX28_04515 [Clostridia bacterium]|nr:hypothetical protein [Clostridia bacterium]
MNQEQNERRLIRGAVVLLAITLILVCVALVRPLATPAKVLLLIGAALPFLLALFLLYLVLLGRRYRKGDHNFFLYDHKRRGNRPPEELTFAHASDCLMRYMALFRRGKQLYLSTLFDENGGAPEAFKPLFCYQLLGMLTAYDSDAPWHAFLSCGKELADALTLYLTQAGEEALARNVQIYFAEFDGENVTPFRDYITQQSDTLAEGMMRYIREHIHDFD